MARIPSFGYHERRDGSVMITRGCSPVRMVPGPDARALLAELAEDDPQETLARWATIPSRAAA
ncbi:hypothetical protein [Streptomyces galbus]|uniref:Uncharacterized protein n=1 Tax=Streptomyces galbus TaxID=33898 RepID=A0ABX1IFE1_STRGB|nr:hypothetical protein [Streptomyces galbus]NKQ24369.1 hypothetical protein [Streptomyces galbus]